MDCLLPTIPNYLQEAVEAHDTGESLVVSGATCTATQAVFVYSVMMTSHPIHVLFLAWLISGRGNAFLQTNVMMFIDISCQLLPSVH